MPYINLSSHNINGFYEDALETNKTGRVVLYAKQSSEATQDVNQKGKNLGDIVKGAEGQRFNNFYKIAVTSMMEPVSIQTSLRWEQGGNLIDAFKLGVKEGMNSVTNAAAEVVKAASNAVSSVATLFNSTDDKMEDVKQRTLNLMMRKYRRKIISAANSYKNYGGSDTSISLPQLEFTFPASDFEATHMQKCYNLLSYLLPINVIKSGKDKDAENKEMGLEEEKKNNQEKRTAQEDNVNNSTYWMYEMPPNNYVNPAMGFNTSYLEGTFALDVCGVQIPDLIPTAVTMVQSRARVLSRLDYQNDRKIDYAMKHFYKDAELEMMLPKNFNSNIPAVVKLFVQFEFAKHITIKDWHSMFFERAGVQGYDAHGNKSRHDNFGDVNAGSPPQYIDNLEYVKNNSGNYSIKN